MMCSRLFLRLHKPSNVFVRHSSLLSAGRVPFRVSTSRLPVRVFGTSSVDNSGEDTGTSTADNAAPHFNPDIDILLERNKQWVKQTKAQDPNFFTQLAKGQQPQYLYFGCSDSRFPANQILGLQAGEVFVHRNVGGLVPGNDLNALSVLEYAVEHLDVKHIIVGGHYDCGAVRAACKTQDLGLIENWTRGIRDVYRLHKMELDMISDPEAKHKRLVELNVIEQCLNLYKTGVVQRHRLKTHKDPNAPFVYPRIHAVVFDVADGVMKKLPVDFRSLVRNYTKIYDLYDLEK